MIVGINAAAMEAIKVSINNPGRNIFYIANEIANERQVAYEDVLKQIAKLDLRYAGIMELVLKK